MRPYFVSEYRGISHIVTAERPDGSVEAVPTMGAHGVYLPPYSSGAFPTDQRLMLVDPGGSLTATWRTSCASASRP